MLNKEGGGNVGGRGALDRCPSLPGAGEGRLNMGTEDWREPGGRVQLVTRSTI